MSIEQNQAIQYFSAGESVWITIEEQTLRTVKQFQGYKKGTIIQFKYQDNRNKQIVYDVQFDDIGVQEVAQDRLNPASDAIKDDLVASDFLTEPQILFNLSQRYYQKQIYTYSGPILIATNPFQSLDIYKVEWMLQYRDRQLGEINPHVYAIAEDAYFTMMRDQAKQAILISGESGAGKTESAKRVMSYLAKRAQTMSQLRREGQKSLQTQYEQPPEEEESQSIPIEDQVLQSNPLLEAFGNAKTKRNHNSSRFGKFVQLHFSRLGQVLGAQVSTFLLERSRVVSIAKGERNYHIFYQICAGANNELKSQLGLGEARSYHYLNQSDIIKIEEPPISDKKEFQATITAMQRVGITDDEQMAILKITAAILHMGNIRFDPNEDEATLSNQNSQDALNWVAHLLGVQKQAMLSSLTQMKRKVGREEYDIMLSPAKASDQRDALAKKMYGKLFDWIVHALNRESMLYLENLNPNFMIGILDIYGFENFEENGKARNSFEQLCINLANERLQQQFNNYIFKEEQQVYESEGITWSYVEFIDNQDCLDLIEGQAHKPNGIFPFIDEMSYVNFQNQNPDKALADKIKQELTGSNRLYVPKAQPNNFGIEHYAGRVVYQCDGMVEKNKDYVNLKHQQMLEASMDSFVGECLTEKISQDQFKGQIYFSSLGFSFRSQLKDLMETLTQCEPHYIRCVKPNSLNKPNIFSDTYVIDQLRAGGVLEALRIARAGYPTRKPFLWFVQRYIIMLDEDQMQGYNVTDPVETSDQDLKSMISIICQKAQLDDYKIGETLVFLRQFQLVQVEKALERRLTEAATVMVSCYQTFFYYKRHRQLQKSVQTVSKTFRRNLQRGRYLQERSKRAAVVLQVCLRQHFAYQIYYQRALLQATLRLQTIIRTQILGKSQLKVLRHRHYMQEQKVVEKAQIVIVKYVRRWLLFYRLHNLTKDRLHIRQLNGIIQSKGNEYLRLQQQFDRMSDRLKQESLNKRTLEQEMGAFQVSQKGEVDGKIKNIQAEYSREIQSVRRNLTSKQETVQAQQDQITNLQNQINQLKVQKSENQSILYKSQEESINMKNQMDQNSQKLNDQISLRDDQLRVLSSKIDDQKQIVENLNQEMARRKQAKNSVINKHYVLKVFHQIVVQDHNTRTLFLEQDTKQLRDQKQKADQTIQGLEQRAKVLEDEVHEARRKLQEQAAEGIEKSPSVISKKYLKELQNLKPDHLEALSSQLNKISRQKSVRPIEKQLPMSRQPSNQHTILTKQPSLVRGMSSNYPSYEADSTPAELLLESLSLDMPDLYLGIEQENMNLPLLPLASYLIGRSVQEWGKFWVPPAMQDFLYNRLNGYFSSKVANKDNSVVFSWTLIALGSSCVVLLFQPQQQLQRAVREWTTSLEILNNFKSAALSVLPRHLEDLFLQKRQSSNLLKRGFGASNNMARNPIESLKGSLLQLSRLLKETGIPPPLIRGLFLGIYSYIDVRIFNRLLVTKELCASSKLKNLLKQIKDILTFSAQEFFKNEQDNLAVAFKNTVSAVRYMLQGKDELTKKLKMMDIKAEIKRLYSSLSVQQIIQLTLNHYDDFTAVTLARQNNEFKALVEQLQQMQRETYNPIRNSQTSGSQSNKSLQPSMSQNGVPISEDKFLLNDEAAFQIPESSIMHAVFSFVGNTNDKKNKFDWLRAIKKLQLEVYNHRDDIPEQIQAYPLLDFLVIRRP